MVGHELDSVQYPLSCGAGSAADPPVAQRLEWHAADGTPLCAHLWCPPDAWGTLLLIHGIGMHSAPYASVAGGFNAAGIALCVPDVRGHGDSGTRGRLPTLRQLTSDLDEVCDQLRQRVPAPLFLGGESMGGLLMAQYARQRQDRFPGVVWVVPAFHVHFSRLLHPPDLGTLWQHRQVLIDSRENLEASSRDLDFVRAKAADRDVVHAVGFSFLAKLGAWGLSWHWHANQFHMPVLMHLAENDHAICNTAATRVYSTLASADKQLVIWPEAMHTLFWDPVTPQLVNTTRDWMRQRVETLSELDTTP